MALVITLLLLVTLQSGAVEGSATFELKLNQFTNPEDRESDGDCCETIFSFIGCGSSCDPMFKICFDNANGDANNLDQCAHGSVSTQVYSNVETVSFSTTLSDTQSNPILRTFSAWPGSVMIKIKVDDHDGSNNNPDPMGTMYEVYSRQMPLADLQTGRNNYVPITFQRNFGTHVITLTAEATVYCDANYYGAACDVYCVPQDDDTNGHYTCDDFGAKICHEDYYGPSCTVLCQGRNNDEGHYNCDQNGNLVCLSGWTNETNMCLTDVNECENATANPCYPNGNCTNLNGTYSCTCNSNYTGENCTEMILHCDRDPCHENNTVQCNNTEDGFICECEEEWTGQVCNTLITPCTSQPCQNNASCSVDNSSYSCTCVGRWYGNQCQTLNTTLISDEYTIYVQGQLSDENRPDFINGVITMLLELEDVTIETLVLTALYLNQPNVTQINMTIRSRTHDVTGLLSDLFSNYNETVVNSYIPNPIYSGQLGEDIRPITVVTEPWVKRHWYIVLVIILILLAIIVALVVILYILRKRRQSKMSKSGFDHHPSGNVSESMPDAAVGFDNSLYFEISHPEKVSGLPSGGHH